MEYTQEERKLFEFVKNYPKSARNSEVYQRARERSRSAMEQAVQRQREAKIAERTRRAQRRADNERARQAERNAREERLNVWKQGYKQGCAEADSPKVRAHVENLCKKRKACRKKTDVDLVCYESMPPPESTENVEAEWETVKSEDSPDEPEQVVIIIPPDGEWVAVEGE